ncbi:MAG TPA: hypothetical protein VM686_05145 [Polyangiaceae bacterium]|nr:hypothetical protein [Polyangiaceae bacterium]
MGIGSFVLLLITFLPGLLALTLGIAPGLAGDAVVIEGTWVRVVFLLAGTAVSLLCVRAIAKQLLGDRADDKEQRIKRAPLVGTVFVGSSVLLFAVAIGGGDALSGEAAEPLRVVFGVYAFWLLIFGLPTLFARKLEAMQPPQPVLPAQPASCSRCGVTLAAGTSICTYCGTPVG